MDWKAEATRWRKAYHALADSLEYTPEAKAKKHKKTTKRRKKSVKPQELLFNF